MKNNSDTNNVSKNIPDINKRILSIIEKYYEGNVSKFSEKIEKSQQQVNRFFNIDNRNNKYPDPLKTDIIDVIDKKFPEINKDWLLTGNGSMLIPQTEEVVPEEEEESYLRTERNKYGLSLQDIHEHTQISVKDLSLYDSGEKEMPKKVRRILEGFFERVEMEYENKDEDEERERTKIPILQTEMMLSSVKVPYYDVDFAGGWTSYELSTQTTPTFIISSPDFARAEFACNLIGNSISNRIKNGSIIGLRRIVDWQIYFPTNELYGVITKNDLRTVKIVKRSKKEGFLELIPDALPEFNNPPYEPEIIPIDYVVDFYQVVAYAFFERLAF